MAKEKIIPPFLGDGFDTRVEIKDPETGALLKYQPYTMTVTQSARGMIRIFERDGRKYWENGEEASDADLQEAVGASHPIFKSSFSPTEKLGNILKKKTDSQSAA